MTMESFSRNFTGLGAGVESNQQRWMLLESRALKVTRRQKKKGDSGTPKGGGGTLQRQA